MRDIAIVQSRKFFPFQPRGRIFFNLHETNEGSSLEDDLFLDAMPPSGNNSQSLLAENRQPQSPLTHLELKIILDTVR